MNYKMANLAFSAVGRKIFNATEGGKLEEFERVQYKTLFQDIPLKYSRQPTVNSPSLVLSMQIKFSLLEII